MDFSIDWQLATPIAQSLITGGSGLLGVFIGGWLTISRDKDREKERIHRESAYLATVAVAHLDRFAHGCLTVAFDTGEKEGRPAGKDGSREETTKAPTFDPLSLDVDWKSLPPTLMYEVLHVPYEQEELERHLGGVWEFDSPPDYSEYFWARRAGYAKLGLAVNKLATSLRQHAGLPICAPEPGAWNAFEEAIKDVEGEMAAAAARQAARGLGL